MFTFYRNAMIHAKHMMQLIRADAYVQVCKSLTDQEKEVLWNVYRYNRVRLEL